MHTYYRCAPSVDNKNCSRIIVLDGGKIVQDGSYGELINEDGLFAELIDRQKLCKRLYLLSFGSYKYLKGKREL